MAAPRDIPPPKPRNDEDKQKPKAIVQDATECDGKDRDLVHGEGGTLDVPVKPADISKDD
jgi:hypothetical protein